VKVTKLSIQIAQCNNNSENQNPAPPI
jgi:hypothetical protein